MRRIVILIAVIASIIFVGASAHAQTGLEVTCRGEAANSPVCQEQLKAGSNPLVGPNGILTRVTQIVVIVAGAAAVIMIIIGGIRYVTSAGDPNNINAAKNTILYAVIGVVVAVLGQAIVSFVLVRLN